MAIISHFRELREKGEGGGGVELNAGANLSVWKGIMPELNIAARLGRHRERERGTG